MAWLRGEEMEMEMEWGKEWGKQWGKQWGGGQVKEREKERAM
jgi:hypothetical protein